VTEAQLISEVARRVFESRQEAGPWMEDYYDLLDEGWDWRKAVYILWASQPKGRRRPETQWELATEILGLASDRVIRDWKARNPAIEQRIAALTASQLIKARADIFSALRESASTPDYKHHQDRKLALEMMGDYEPSQSLGVKVLREPEDFEQADAEDLAAAANIPGRELDG
jgi:hypothetical protein